MKWMAFTILFMSISFAKETYLCEKYRGGLSERKDIR